MLELFHLDKARWDKSHCPLQFSTIPYAIDVSMICGTHLSLAVEYLGLQFLKVVSEGLFLLNNNRKNYLHKKGKNRAISITELLISTWS
jgi:hypothetical protein